MKKNAKNSTNPTFPLFKKPENWVVVDDAGKVLKRFRYVLTAKNAITRLRLNKNDKLKVVHISEVEEE